MEHEFSRTESLIGRQGLAKLRRSTVLIFGIGGVGSYATEALARSALGHFILVDHDDISLTNINRQIHALRSTLGKSKVDVMKERILEINPSARVETRKQFFTSENTRLFFTEQPDYVIDAIDTVPSKVALIKECLSRKIPLISSMGAGNRLNAEHYQVTDISKTSGDPLAKALRKRLRQEGISKGVKVVSSPLPPLSPSSPASSGMTSIPGSVSFVPSVVGLLIAGEVVRDLLKD